MSKENTTTIHEVLHTIQKELKAPKNQRNDFGKYNYRSCEDILDAVKKILPENFYILLSDIVENIGCSNYIKATATLADGVNSISTTAYAREAIKQSGMQDAQLTGSTSSYARKYALNGLFCIDDTKDADATNDHKEELKTTKSPVKITDKSGRATDKQIKLIMVKLGQKQLDENYITEQLNIESIKDLPFGEVNNALKLIEEYEPDVEM